MTIGCSPRLRHWAPIRRLYGSVVCQHLKAQTTRALQRKNNSACAMRLWAGPYCMSFYPWMWSWTVQDKSTNCGATFCPITALRVTEAEQELAAGSSDVEAVLPEEHGWPSAISFYPGNLTRRRGKLKTCRMIFLLMIKFSKDDDWSDLTHCASDWLVSDAFVSWVQVWGVIIG